MEILLVIIGMAILVDIYLRIKAIRSGSLTGISGLEDKLNSIEKKVNDLQKEIDEVKSMNTGNQMSSEFDTTKEYKEE